MGSHADRVKVNSIPRYNPIQIGTNRNKKKLETRNKELIEENMKLKNDMIEMKEWIKSIEDTMNSLISTL